MARFVAAVPEPAVEAAVAALPGVKARKRRARVRQGTARVTVSWRRTKRGTRIVVAPEMPPWALVFMAFGAIGAMLAAGVVPLESEDLATRVAAHLKGVLVPAPAADARFAVSEARFRA